MVYILDQRLRAQSIPVEKSRKGAPPAAPRGRSRSAGLPSLLCDLKTSP